LIDAKIKRKPFSQAGLKAYLDFSPKKFLLFVNRGQTKPVTDEPSNAWRGIFEITLSQGN